MADQEQPPAGEKVSESPFAAARRVWDEGSIRPPAPAGERREAMVQLAREATSKLRDAAREGQVISFRERDPLVMAIHRALDLVALPAARPEPPALTLEQVKAAFWSVVNGRPATDSDYEESIVRPFWDAIEVKLRAAVHAQEGPRDE